jgi:hypothetical protein
MNLQTPIRETGLISNDLRDITPKEQNHYQIIQQVYEAHCKRSPCNRKYRAYLDNVNNILNTGKIPTYNG